MGAAVARAIGSQTIPILLDQGMALQYINSHMQDIYGWMKAAASRIATLEKGARAGRSHTQGASTSGLQEVPLGSRG